MACAQDKHSGSVCDSAQVSDLPRIANAQIGTLILTCGVCDGEIEIEFLHLDEEAGGIDGIEAFPVCPECGEVNDASGVRFSVGVE